MNNHVLYVTIILEGGHNVETKIDFVVGPQEDTQEVIQQVKNGFKKTVTSADPYGFVDINTISGVVDSIVPTKIIAIKYDK